MPTLLIAGPIALDDLPDHPGSLGGEGAYAAIAAAPLATTQLWAQGGSDINHQVRDLLKRRHVDLAGVTWQGPVHQGTVALAGPDSVLPQLEPTEADNVGAVLLVGLPAADLARAVNTVRNMPGGETRPLLIRPRLAGLDGTLLAQAAAAADVLLIPQDVAMAMTGTASALAAGRALQKQGAKTVLLSAGALGGTICYGQLATTWPTAPCDSDDTLANGAVFAGAVAAWCGGAGAVDFSAVKRATAVASAVVTLRMQGPGPRRLLSSSREEYLDRFNRLRRNAKY